MFVEAAAGASSTFCRRRVAGPGHALDPGVVWFQRRDFAWVLPPDVRDRKRRFFPLV